MPAPHAARKAVEGGHLSGRRAEQGLLSPAAAERSGAKVRDERPVAQHHRITGLEQVDDRDRRQRLGAALGQRARQRRRGRRTGLGAGLAVDRYPGIDRRTGHVQAVLCEGHGGYHGGGVHRAEGAPGEPAFAAGERVEHRQELRHVPAQGDAGGDVLLRPRRAGVEGVRVELEEVRDVGGDHRAGEPLEVLEHVAQACQIVDVAQRARAVAAGVDVEHLHRRTAGAEVHRAVARLEIETRVAAVDGEASGGPGEGVLDQGTGIEEPSRLAERAAVREGPRPSRGRSARPCRPAPADPAPRDGRASRRRR